MFHIFAVQFHFATTQLVIKILRFLYPMQAVQKGSAARNGEAYEAPRTLCAQANKRSRDKADEPLSTA
jgi:hypothetical protein